MQLRTMAIVRLHADAGHRCLKCKGAYSLRLRFKRDVIRHLVYGVRTLLAVPVIWYLPPGLTGIFRYSRHKMSQNEIIEGGPQEMSVARPCCPWHAQANVRARPCCPWHAQAIVRARPCASVRGPLQ